MSLNSSSNSKSALLDTLTSSSLSKSNGSVEKSLINFGLSLLTIWSCFILLELFPPAIFKGLATVKLVAKGSGGGLG